jgi:hypothetical protein
MVAIGNGWWAGLSILAVACGGHSQRNLTSSEGDAGQGGSSPTYTPPGTAGTLPTPSGGGGAGGTAGAGGIAGGMGGTAGAAGAPSECVLEGVVGLHECPSPDHRALLAYAGWQLEPCAKLTGPFDDQTVDGIRRCLYNFDERGCGIDYEGDAWIELPWFGYEGPPLTIPASASPSACAKLSGAPVTSSSPIDLARRLRGVWLTCQVGVEDIFPGNVMAFSPDGTFQALQEDAQGRLSRVEECNARGLWGFVAGTGQLNLYWDDKSYPTFPTFTTNGRVTFSNAGPGASPGVGWGLVQIQ